jgi:hypothetical protein
MNPPTSMDCTCSRRIFVWLYLQTDYVRYQGLASRLGLGFWFGVRRSYTLDVRSFIWISGKASEGRAFGSSNRDEVQCPY